MATETAIEKKQNWLGCWSGLFHCGKCLALISAEECAVCGHKLPEQPDEVIRKGDLEYRITRNAVQGAISYTAVSLLALMQQEWQRPQLDEQFQHSFAKGCSQRVLIVLLFWTLLEHIMDQFFRTATSSLPAGVAAELLQRYPGIGARMDRLYLMLFDAKLKDDLEKLRYGDVFAHLRNVQERRNEFVHGNSEAIDDALVRETVERLGDVQAAWVALFNLRCTGDPEAPKMFEDRYYRDFVARHSGSS